MVGRSAVTFPPVAQEPVSGPNPGDGSLVNDITYGKRTSSPGDRGRAYGALEESPDSTGQGAG